MAPHALSHLDKLEAESIHILREVAAEFRNPVMLYSVGKDSSVLLHLLLKAFYPARPPIPLLHVDTGWKFGEMISFRDQRAREHLVNATALGQQTGTADSEAQRSLRGKAEQALQARLELAARRGDGADAGKVIALADEFGLSRAASSKLIAQARGIAGDGSVARGLSTSAISPAASVAVSFNPRPV
ncbi:phosphoadenosine phosphosulfate reductase family protein, partial [Lysobacter sp. 2RAB21]